MSTFFSNPFTFLGVAICLLMFRAHLLILYLVTKLMFSKLFQFSIETDFVGATFPKHNELNISSLCYQEALEKKAEEIHK